MENAGIPVICSVGTKNNIESLKDLLMVYAQVLGPEAIKKAQEYNTYFDQKEKSVTSITSKIADTIFSSLGYKVRWQDRIRIIPPGSAPYLRAATAAAQTNNRTAADGIIRSSYQAKFNHLIKIRYGLLPVYSFAQAHHLKMQCCRTQENARCDGIFLPAFPDAHFLGARAARAGH